tara:strand:- start:770 stop:982 length:213 start_codon:yes stop_codon:yes gene_type:complete
MNNGGIISGIVMCILGCVMLYFGMTNPSKEGAIYVLVSYGLIILLLGLYILFHLRSEDKIEEVKNIKKRK